jgi:hypothetical protein
MKNVDSMCNVAKGDGGPMHAISNEYPSQRSYVGGGLSFQLLRWIHILKIVSPFQMPILAERVKGEGF